MHLEGPADTFPTLSSRRRSCSSPGEGAQVRSDAQERSLCDGEVRMRRGGCGPHFPGPPACLAPPSVPESLSSRAAGLFLDLLWAPESWLR